MPQPELINDFNTEPSGCIAYRLGEVYLSESNLAESIKWFTRGLLFKDYSRACAELLQVICVCEGKNSDAYLLSARFERMAKRIISENIIPEKREVRTLSIICYKTLNQEVIYDPFLRDSDPQPKSTAPALKI